MATTQTQVVNLALTKLGQDRVININDDVEIARVIRSIWDLTLDCVLADHPWKFAILRTTLPALAAAPAYGWEREFAIPEECLRLVQVGDDWIFYTGEAPTFALEGGSILTDEEAPLRVRYVQRIINVGLWPPLFARAVAMRLAADSCEKLTGNSKKAEMAEIAYSVSIKTAKRQNAIERPPERQVDGDWLGSRGD
jgi:hypothetical protein